MKSSGEFHWDFLFLEVLLAKGSDSLERQVFFVSCGSSYEGFSGKFPFLAVLLAFHRNIFRSLKFSLRKTPVPWKGKLSVPCSSSYEGFGGKFPFLAVLLVKGFGFSLHFTEMISVPCDSIKGK
ncbi:hypothetical protein C1646_753449 [Rhizophagus diaphanus]|nr:hypothetical protein C1646_753449 [Rhizophagus diaphanus] [Rhizophagus sp. MUCL 43196]